MTLYRLLIVFFIYTSYLFAEAPFYRIGRDPVWSPLDLKNDTYNVTAFTDALMREIGKAEGVNLELVDTSSVVLFSDLCRGKYEAVITSIAPNDRFDFSSPLILLGPVLVVREDSEIKTLNDLKNRKVGVNAYDASERIAGTVPGTLIKLYDNMPVALDDLAKGELEGVLIASMQAHALIPHRYSGVLRITTPPLNEDGIRLATLKKRGRALVTLFNRGVKKIKKKGLYKYLRLEYGVN